VPKIYDLPDCYSVGYWDRFSAGVLFWGEATIASLFGAKQTWKDVLPVLAVTHLIGNILVLRTRL